MSRREQSIKRFEAWVAPLFGEFLGVLLLTFVHCMAAQNRLVLVSALNDGLFVTILIVTVGPISGAHLNAAVTVALTLVGGLRWAMAPFYIIVQLAGAFVGAKLAQVASGQAAGYFSLGDGIRAEQAALMEVIITGILVLTVLQSAYDMKSRLAAFAVGFAVAVGVLTGARVSGACMNPTISLGDAIVADYWDCYWVYWVGPMIGALAAVASHKLVLASRKKRAVFGERKKSEDCLEMKGHSYTSGDM